MSGFIEAAFSFPTVVFTPLLIVVIGYWVVVIAGGADPEGDASVAGLSGVPVPVVVSLLVLFAWFGALAGGQTSLNLWLVLGGTVVASWLLTRLAVVGLRRVMPTGAEPSRSDFVGLTCVIRTGRVTDSFGQAEVHSLDGSSAVIQVRQTGSDALTAGTLAVIYEADPTGEFFWVVPADIATRPDQ